MSDKVQKQRPVLQKAIATCARGDIKLHFPDRTHEPCCFVWGMY